MSSANTDGCRNETNGTDPAKRVTFLRSQECENVVATTGTAPAAIRCRVVAADFTNHGTWRGFDLIIRLADRDTDRSEAKEYADESS